MQAGVVKEVRLHAPERGTFNTGYCQFDSLVCTLPPSCFV